VAVALLDTRRTDNPATPSARTDGQDFPSNEQHLADAALREAGAQEVIYSPRRMNNILPLIELYLSKHAGNDFPLPKPHQSFENWAWSLLPWQDVRRPLG
jgi:hypothetical protein